MELHSSSPDGSKDSYGKLFGWGMQNMPMGDETCTMFKTTDSDDDVHGGITQSSLPMGPRAALLMFWSRTSTRL